MPLSHSVRRLVKRNKIGKDRNQKMLLTLLNRFIKLFIVVLSLLSIADCATSIPIPTPDENSTPVPRRIFVDLRVYSATPGTVSQYYDSTADKILGENVWFFRPDGTYSAIINDEGEVINLSGVYSGDDVGGDVFIFSIETNNDSEYDESLYTDDDFSFIEWRREIGTFTYYRAK